MTVELKKGYYIDSYYDKNTRSYITTLRDKDGNQIRDAYYSGNMTDRSADIQHIKEFFEQYLNEALNLRKTIKDTKEKTKKAKLPALSTLSPIMPDAAAGIDNFNSSVGLSEEWIHRDELEARLKKMGFKYKFNKYTDKQLYRIYQERLKYLEKKHKEKEKKKRQESEAENKRVNSKDSFMKNGIEFESEDAAREYFGESMKNKLYLNDMLASYDIEDNEIKQPLNESNKDIKHNFKTITEGLKYFERKEFNENCRDAELESLYEGIKNSLDQDDIKKLGNFLKKADSADDVATYIRGLLSEDIDNENFNDVTIGLYGGDETFPYPEDFYSFIDKCKKLGITVSNDSCDEYMNWEMDLTGNGYTIYKLCRNFPGYDNVEFSANDWIHEYRIDESLTEARKPKYVDSLFGKNVKDAMDKGELTYNNIKEWDRKYNGGRDPIPAFNTRELMNFYSDHPNYFNESYSGSIENISVEEIEPQQKDYDRAKGLKFRGSTFKGSGEPFGSEASKMAKLIKDPIKLVRRAKAIVATYGADEGYMSNNGWYHHVAPDKESDVWGPFKRRLEEFGFTNDQINLIRNFKPLVESLNEDWESGDLSIAEMTAEDILIGAEEEYGIDASLYNIDFNEDTNTADIAISVVNSNDFMKFIEQYFKPPIPFDVDKLVDVYEDEVKDDEIIYTLVVKFKDKDTSIFNKDIDSLTNELVNQLSQAGFIIDKNSSGITDNIMGGKHIQVINPNLFYPTSETEGEDITDDEAYKLFRDDLREVEGILDAFEDKYDKILFITFNFGHNKDMVITGGIDIHLFKGSK